VVAASFKADLEKAMSPPKLVANIVETWRALADGRSTVAFCCTRKHAEQVSEEFKAAGVGAAFMDCNTPNQARREVRAAMLRGEVKVVCNVDVVGLGVDWPEVSCIIYARPTKSDKRFCQNIGRGLRAAPGKSDLLILDHSSTSQRLGFVNEVYALHTTLDDGAPKPKKPEGVALPKECPECGFLKAPRLVKCPNCGHEVQAHAKPILCERGTLKPFVEKLDPMADVRKQLPDREHCYGQLVWWARYKGYKPGWAWRKTQELFGSAPRGEPAHISEPVPELQAWLRKSAQDWARKQRYAANSRGDRQRATNLELIRQFERHRDAGSLGPRGQAVIDRAQKFVDGTLMTPQDFEEFH
jgi:helicase-like protein